MSGMDPSEITPTIYIESYFPPSTVDHLIIFNPSLEVDIT